MTLGAGFNIQLPAFQVVAMNMARNWNASAELIEFNFR